MRQRRYQNPEPKKRKHGRHWVWVGQYRDQDRTPRTKVLGRCSEMSKGEAEAMLAAILQPVNAGVPRRQAGPASTFKQFVQGVYFRICRRKNKASTMMTTEQAINQHLVAELGPRRLPEIPREDLQSLLDAKAARLCRSVVDHLRWDLRAIYNLAISEGVTDRNPALSLYTPKCRQGRERRELAAADIPRVFAVLDLRERLIVKFAILEGLRPGETLGFQWQDFGDESFDVRRRVYRGDIDGPKTRKSVRTGGLSRTTLEDLRAWKAMAPNPQPEGWVFPSENPHTPLSRDNVLRRHIRPRLEQIGLGWVTFQTMRRANASLGRKAGVDDKVAADQRGHGLGTSLEVYATSDLEEKLKAVRKLEAVVLQ